MKSMNIWFGFILLIVYFSSAHAELDKYDAEALSKTQEFLKDKSKREAYINNTPKAQVPINQMKGMGVDESQQNEVFDMSSAIFGQLVNSNNGNAEAIKKLLLQAEQNPEAFYNSLSPEIKGQIKALGMQLESNGINIPK